MNKKLQAVLSKENSALHDLYKDISQIYINEMIQENKSEFYEFVKKDYRLTSLLDVKNLSLEEMQELIELNPETLYSLYNQVKTLDLFEYIVKKENLDDNIYTTILNVLSNNAYISFEDSLTFVESNIDKFASRHSINRFVESKTDLEYTFDELLRIAKLGLLKPEFYNYDSYLIRFENLDLIAQSLVNIINADIEKFYILYKEVAINSPTIYSDFLVNFFDLGFESKLEYEKIIDLYNQIKDTQHGEHLIYFCIQQNWLQVFDDLGLDYLQSMFNIFSLESPNLELIKDFDGVKFSKKLSAIPHYKLNWREYSKFLTFYEYIKLKFSKRDDIK